MVKYDGKLCGEKVSDREKKIMNHLFKQNQHLFKRFSTDINVRTLKKIVSNNVNNN